MVSRIEDCLRRNTLPLLDELLESANVRELYTKIFLGPLIDLLVWQWSSGLLYSIHTIYKHEGVSSPELRHTVETLGSDILLGVERHNVRIQLNALCSLSGGAWRQRFDE